MDAVPKTKRRVCQYPLEVGMSRTKEKSIDLRVSSSNHMAQASSETSSEGKIHERRVAQKAVKFKQIDKRMRILEDEVVKLRQDFFVSIEDRNKLMAEICQQFQAIHNCLRLRDKEKEEKLCDEALAIMPSKDGRMGTGLSQVLSQESNSSLVVRDLRVNIIVFQDPAVVVDESFHLRGC